MNYLIFYLVVALHIVTASVQKRSKSAPARTDIDHHLLDDTLFFLNTNPRNQYTRYPVFSDVDPRQHRVRPKFVRSGQSLPHSQSTPSKEERFAHPNYSHRDLPVLPIIHNGIIPTIQITDTDKMNTYNRRDLRTLWSTKIAQDLYSSLPKSQQTKSKKEQLARLITKRQEQMDQTLDTLAATIKKRLPTLNDTEQHALILRMVNDLELNKM